MREERKREGEGERKTERKKRRRENTRQKWHVNYIHTHMGAMARRQNPQTRPRNCDMLELKETELQENTVNTKPLALSFSSSLDVCTESCAVNEEDQSE